MRPSRTQRAAQCAAAAILMLVPAEVAAAASSVTSGWWTTAETPPPPDVPPDGLLVQSTVTPTAYAAVSFRLDDNERPDSLTLTIVEGSASNPATTLRLCPLTEPIEAAHGGPASEAPAYDCTESADAAPDDGSYVFDVSTLPHERTFGVAVLPTGPLDRAVLAAPDVASLSTVTTSVPTAPPRTTDPNSPPPPSTGDGFVTPPPLTPSPSSPGTPPDGADLPPVDEADATPPTTTVSREVAQPTLPLDPRTGSATSRIAQAALAGALLVALALWLSSGTLAHSRARRNRHGASAPT